MKNLTPILLFFFIFAPATKIFSQNIMPTPDSCLIKFCLKSNDSIPYRDKIILFKENKTDKRKTGITDSTGEVDILLKKAVNYQVSILNGIERVWYDSIKTPDRKGLINFKYELFINIFTEDRENEIFITDQFSHKDTLAPSDSLSLVNVTLTTMNNKPIANTSVLFRNPITKEIFVGQTNQEGIFHILLPKEVNYGIRLIQNGNRIPLDELSTHVGKGKFTQTLNLQYNFTKESCYYENLNCQDKISEALSEQILPQRFILKNIYFDFGKAVIRPISYPELLKFSELLKGNKNLVIVIEGHTDSIGDDDYNLELSKKRANAVMNFLIETGVDPKRLSAVGYGELRPIASNESADGRQQNRRTEIKVVKQ